MTLDALVSVVNAKILTSHKPKTQTITCAFACDLMSDALMLLRELQASENANTCLLVTGLPSIQSIRTAEILDLSTILYVRNRKPSVEVIALAEACGITLLTTSHLMFTTSGLLFKHGVVGATHAIL